jgi:uncharacterized membrane protein YqiK
VPLYLDRREPKDVSFVVVVVVVALLVVLIAFWNRPSFDAHRFGWLVRIGHFSRGTDESFKLTVPLQI